MMELSKSMLTKMGTVIKLMEELHNEILEFHEINPHLFKESRGRKKFSDKAETILKLKSEGLSNVQIGKEVNCSNQYVSQVIRRSANGAK
jgi:DNA-binding NarL/FixJ family response regulator|tara:strand:+ start:17568 stop:17837 length:270 start_codon:yes stop_codon:yes gene_type:complete